MWAVLTNLSDEISFILQKEQKVFPYHLIVMVIWAKRIAQAVRMLWAYKIYGEEKRFFSNLEMEILK